MLTRCKTIPISWSGIDHLTLHPLPSSLARSTDATVHLLSHLYVQRWGDLWQADNHSPWLSECIESVTSLPPVPTSANKDRSTILAAKTFQASIYRHVIVLEKTCRSLFSFVPNEILNSRQLACDPLPPYLKVSEYNVEFFQGVEDVLGYHPRRPNAREEERLLRRLIPDGVFRRQLQVGISRLASLHLRSMFFRTFFWRTPILPSDSLMVLSSSHSWRHNYPKMPWKT